MAQKAEEYGSHDKTFEIPADGVVRVVDAAGTVLDASTRSRPATSGACARPRTPPIRDWVKLAVDRARATGAPAVFWLDEDRAHDAAAHREGRQLPRRPRHRRARHPDHVARSRPRASRSSASGGQGHHLGHRQRAARLPHRPVPDPRARHQRQDAVDRAADERRRPVRDRRRRLGPQARAAVRRRRTTCAGTRSASSWPWRCRSSTSPSTFDNAAGPGAGRHARRRHRASCSRTASRPSRKVGELDNRGSHFYLALYWAEALAAQTDDADAGRALRPARRAARRTARRPSSTS